MGLDAEDLPFNPAIDTSKKRFLMWFDAMGAASPFHLPLVKNM